jgi:hypothetical protein
MDCDAERERKKKFNAAKIQLNWSTALKPSLFDRIS